MLLDYQGFQGSLTEAGQGCVSSNLKTMDGAIFRLWESSLEKLNLKFSIWIKPILR